MPGEPPPARAALALAARRRIRWSHGITAVVLLGGLGVGLVGAVMVAASPEGRAAELSPGQVMLIAAAESVIGAYSTWALFWGVPAAWRWWLAVSARVGRPVERLPFAARLFAGIPMIAAFYVPVALGALYGFFGGGIREYIRYRRIARGADAPLEPPRPSQ